MTYCVARCPSCNRLSIALFSSKTHGCPFCRKRFELRPPNERRIIFAGDHISCREFLINNSKNIELFIYKY
jgi:hypothetical protein